MGKKYGKWIGGGLGWVLGGPIGAIVGFFFGSMVDSMNSAEFEIKPHTQTTMRGDFIVSLLVLSAAVMKADGKIMKSELEYIKTFFRQQFGEEQMKQKILLLREILKQNIDIPAVSEQVKQFMDYSARLQLLHYLFGISLADGNIKPTEIDIIEQISINMGIAASDFKSIKGMFVKDILSSYNILEVSPDATDEEIKKAYRKMALKYHPDKVSHLGEDIQKAAKEKFQKLQEAYEEIKAARGMA
ncbi:MAG TPA: TerB family tellurite resistance protein [Bacteroidales bacterium]|nr:TerB family tellurite resistance protein [Bacteroidales bacterium]